MIHTEGDPEKVMNIEEVWDADDEPHSQLPDGLQYWRGAGASDKEVSSHSRIGDPSGIEHAWDCDTCYAASLEFASRTGWPRSLYYARPWKKFLKTTWTEVVRGGIPKD